jgi:hypothetical protein
VVLVVVFVAVVVDVVTFVRGLHKPSRSCLCLPPVALVVVVVAVAVVVVNGCGRYRCRASRRCGRISWSSSCRGQIHYRAVRSAAAAIMRFPTDSYCNTAPHTGAIKTLYATNDA